MKQEDIEKRLEEDLVIPSIPWELKVYINNLSPEGFRLFQEAVKRDYEKHIERITEMELSNMSPLEKGKKYQHELNLKLRDSNKE